ncbi:putative nucleotidyltransferase [Nocardia sp. GAS34]|uniref:hypothetical protein n=1 Tax=unclassified Nocardia TaxID=2637762 RepID=UPI003D1D1DB5
MRALNHFKGPTGPDAPAPIRVRGIVRTDLTPDSDTDVAAIYTLADALAVEQEPVLIANSERGFPLLFALLDVTDVTAIVVPDTRHLGDWLPIVRTQVEIWTLRPARFPRTCR